MQAGKRHKNKKKIIADLLSGRDVLDDLLPALRKPFKFRWFNERIEDDPPNDANRPSWFMPKPFSWMIDDEPVSEETFNSELNAARERGEFVLHAQHSSKNEPLKPDPQFPDIQVSAKSAKEAEEMLLPVSYPATPNLPESSEGIEPSKVSVQAKIKPLLKRGSQEYLKAKLEQDEQEMECQLEEREKSKRWNLMNNDLNNHIAKILR